MTTTIEVWKVRNAAHPFPWRFAVTHGGVRHFYAGIPNMCETERSARARAAWRAKWMREGTYHKRYRPA